METRSNTPEYHVREAPSHHAAPGAESWTQSEFKLHTWIAGIAVVLCAFVTVLFIRQGAVPAAVAFGVIGLISLVDFGRVYRKRRNEHG